MYTVLLGSIGVSSEQCNGAAHCRGVAYILRVARPRCRCYSLPLRRLLQLVAFIPRPCHRPEQPNCLVVTSPAAPAGIVTVHSPAQLVGPRPRANRRQHRPGWVVLTALASCSGWRFTRRHRVVRSGSGDPAGRLLLLLPLPLPAARHYGAAGSGTWACPAQQARARGLHTRRRRAPPKMSWLIPERCCRHVLAFPALPCPPMIWSLASCWLAATTTR